MAANAVFPVQYRSAILIHPDCLMSSILAGNPAPAATNAAFPDKLRKNDCVPFQRISRIAQCVQSKTDRLCHVSEAFLRQVHIQACFQVVYDPIAVLHHSGCNLDGSAAHQDELHRVLPGLDSAHCGQVHAFQVRVLSQLGNKPQGYSAGLISPLMG